MLARRLRHAAMLAVALAALMPTSSILAAGPDPEQIARDAACRAGRSTDSRGLPCDAKTRHQTILEAKADAANAYHQLLLGKGSRQAYEAAQYTVSRLTGETIGKHDWSTPETTPAALKVRGQVPAYDYGPLQKRFWPFQQINSWYCGPATAQSILWFLGPHRSESHDEVWGGRPSLTGNPYEDQWLLANDFWLATNRYQGTNWGERYMPFTLNAWRGSFWYVMSEAPGAGGDLTKEQALVVMRYAFDHSYPVAENVLYSPRTYYPYGFWPGVTYQHWDVIYGYREDPDGRPYVQVGQVYADSRFEYRRFQQVAWDVHWGAIANWHGIVW